MEQVFDGKFGDGQLRVFRVESGAVYRDGRGAVYQLEVDRYDDAGFWPEKCGTGQEVADEIAETCAVDLSAAFEVEVLRLV